MMTLTEDAQRTPIGAQEIAALLHVERATVDQWRIRLIFPDRDWTVGGRPAWNTSTVIEWAERTNREIRIHGPGSIASNAAGWNTCEECGVLALFELYIDDNGAVTHQATNARGDVMCDACAG